MSSKRAIVDLGDGVSAIVPASSDTTFWRAMAADAKNAEDDPWLALAGASGADLTAYSRWQAEQCRLNGCDGGCRCDD